MDQTDWQIMQQEMRNAGAKIYNNRFTDPIPGSAYVLIYRDRRQKAVPKTKIFREEVHFFLKGVYISCFWNSHREEVHFFQKEVHFFLNFFSRFFSIFPQNGYLLVPIRLGVNPINNLFPF